VALVKGIESGDTDLGISTLDKSNSVFIVLQHLRRTLPLAQFFRVINDKPVASQLFEAWAKKYDRELLKDFYYQDDRKSASAGVLIHESFEQKVPQLSSHTNFQTLAARIDKLQLAKKIYSESKEFAFEAKVHPGFHGELMIRVSTIPSVFSNCKNLTTKNSNPEPPMLASR